MSIVKMKRLRVIGFEEERDELLQKVWGYDYGGETRTVDVHVGTLRQKLGDCSGYVETVRGIGYRLGGLGK